MARAPAPLWPDAPRYGGEEPFPAHPFVPGCGARPPHVAPPPGRDAALKRGIDLYHAGFLWEAHEAWEAAWKRAREPGERALFGGLIQLAAALLQSHRGIEKGARKLAAAARTRLVRAGPHRFGLDLERVVQSLDRCFSAAPDARWPLAPRFELRTRRTPPG